MGKPKMTPYLLANANDFCMLLDIIAAIHKCKIIHRDIKPSNFFKYKNEVLFCTIDKLFLTISIS
jgi:serine/threonine protein kinase